MHCWAVPRCRVPLGVIHHEDVWTLRLGTLFSLILVSGERCLRRWLCFTRFEVGEAQPCQAVVNRCPFPAELKQITWLSTVGLLMVIFGDCLRKAAMLTAGSNFNHIVQNEKSDTHTLVTSGVYGWFRHPSYVGWFYWSIGTQVPCTTCFRLTTQVLLLRTAPCL